MLPGRPPNEWLHAADTTLMAPEIFDAMMASLDVADESSELETLSKLPRLIRR